MLIALCTVHILKISFSTQTMLIKKLQLPSKAPQVHTEFQTRGFGVNESRPTYAFNNIATDQALEHINRIKGKKKILYN